MTRPAIRVPLFSNSQGFCLSFVGVLDRPMCLGSVIVARNAGWFTVHVSDHWRSLFKLARGFRLLGCSEDSIVTLKRGVLISLTTQENTQRLSISVIRVSWLRTETKRLNGKHFFLRKSRILIVSGRIYNHKLHLSSTFKPFQIQTMPSGWICQCDNNVSFKEF